MGPGQVGATLGRVAVVGDVDRDAKLELVIGAWAFDSGGLDTGRL